jgi:DNA-binding MarR family transcriptional regulator
MTTTEKQTLELVDQVAELSQELLQRLDLLSGGGSISGNISNSQYRTLSVVHKHSPRTMGNLSKLVGSAMSTTSEMMSRLVKIGFITKVRGPLDGRVVMVELTAEGERLLLRRCKSARDGYQKLISRMSPGEDDLFLSAMKQLEALLRKGMEQESPLGGTLVPL